MSLGDVKGNLESIASDAKVLKQKLEALNGAANTSEADRRKLDEIFDKLDQQLVAVESAEADARQARIRQLDEEIGNFDAVLSTPGISPETREIVKSERNPLLAERARLAGQAGTDFRGILTKDEADSFKRKVLDARREAEQKKKIAAGIAAALAATDVALTIVGKLKFLV